jgi:hypothetical protein
VHGGHSNDERKQVVNDRVEEPVDHCFLGHMLNGLQLVVDVQLGSHLDKAEQIDGTHQGIQNKRIG